MEKEIKITDWIEDVINGKGGYMDFEDREILSHPNGREQSIASFVIRCLANPKCEGSESVLNSILENRKKKQHGKDL